MVAAVLLPTVIFHSIMIIGHADWRVVRNLDSSTAGGQEWIVLTGLASGPCVLLEQARMRI
jgi:hypothetical protein